MKLTTMPWVLIAQRPQISRETIACRPSTSATVRVFLSDGCVSRFMRRIAASTPEIIRSTLLKNCFLVGERGNTRGSCGTNES